MSVSYCNRVFWCLTNLKSLAVGIAYKSFFDTISVSMTLASEQIRSLFGVISFFCIISNIWSIKSLGLIIFFFESVRA